ncbi:hypothetical protein BW897_29125 [Bacillus cereus]|uniref:Uncharacterized protein n=1 Tax=Bacillus cereus TaxID=1396 RepID=A0A1S9TH34_BACCE|nr:hypothetical protein [Bacillus mycoides]OOR09187.1 hypothetical protein BW897_29125 [Bacillus cereus]QBP90196.1 hypothetical protein E1A90_01250 [Bacillus mycoides]QBP90207.1 hypothetical protein E1A90_01335 [Bacillus mycoides]QWH75561.1 hypothetical protein EXW59_01515 [Bacillus mycoides]
MISCPKAIPSSSATCVVSFSTVILFFLLERKKGHTCTVGMVRKVCPSRKLCFIYIIINFNIMVFRNLCKCYLVQLQMFSGKSLVALN